MTCRIPPRVRIREDAPVELPHVLLLCDDRSDGLMKWMSGKIFTTKRWNFLRFIELLQRQMKKHYWMSFKKTCCAPEGYPVQWYTKERQGVLYLNPNKSRLAVAILQNFLDEYLKNHRGQMDYIHGEEALKNLAEKENAVGFLLPAMEKRELFPYVTESGTLPRKTFSMGHATEKRYYLEARQIR